MRGRRYTETAPNKRAAEKLYAKRINEQEEGRAFGKAKFSKVAGEYAELIAAKQRDSGTRFDYALKHLLPAFGNMLLSDIQNRDVLRYVQGRKAAPATVAKELRFFKAIWAYAKKNNLAAHDPAQGVTVAEPRPVTKSPLTAEEEERLWSVFRKHSPLPLYQFLALTGCRSQEARLLKKDNVNLDKRVAYVLGKTRKGDELQPVHLSVVAVELLRGEMKKTEGEYVFVSWKTGKPYTTVKKTFREAVKRAGLSDKIKSPHDLRHLFVSRLVQSGHDHVRVMKLSRHRDLRMLDRYAHLAPEELHEALDETFPKKKEGPRN